MTSAQLCREKGWVVGTVLEGDEGYGMERIRISAIGEERVLAVRVGEPPFGGTFHEHAWSLIRRKWRVVAMEAKG